MKSWNPVLNIVKDVLQEYRKKMSNKEVKFEEMLEYVSNEKSSFFDCLQMNQHGKFLLIRYGLAEMDRGMWTDQDSPYRECRSVVIDLEKERLVTCGFRKFFNMNEVEETQLEVLQEKIYNAEVFEITDKLDGSMQNARWYEGEVFMTGSMALDENESWRLKNGKELLNGDYIQMIKDLDGFTFTFEYISDKNPHVVSYDSEDEGLYLLGIRNINSGRQLGYNQVINIANTYDVKVVKRENKTLEELLQEMKTQKADVKEGWVMNIDGMLVKIKCDDYVNIHRLLDRVASPNVIIQAIADETYDDLISRVPKEYRDRVEGFGNKVMDYVKNTSKSVSEAYKDAPKDGEKKEFMMWVNQNVKKELQGLVRNRYLGKEINFLKNGNTGYKKANDIGLGVGK